MFYFNKKETNYDDKDHLLDKGIPMVPESTHSRSEDHTYPMYIIPIQNDTPFNSTNKTKRYCRIIANITLIIGIALVVISALFKLQSRVYISKAIENECPVNCVTTCYSRIPFNICDFDQRSKCDNQCLSVGIQTANTYAILFMVFVSLGGLLVVAQVVNSCIGYCCYDYITFKNQQGHI